MSKITNLKLWKDTGYTDGSTEMPPLNHTLKPYDVLYSKDIFPAKERIFSEIQIPLDYVTLMDMSYLSFELEMNNNETKTFYGWIDDVVLQSDSENAASCNIKWHIDPWRTFGIGAKFGSGFVKRRPSTNEDYYQSFPYRNLSVDNTTDMMTKWRGIGWWVLFCAQTKDGDKVSSITYYTFPLVAPEPNQNDYWVSNVDQSTKGVCPRYDAIMAARFDEVFGFNPDTITGAWLCPIQPMKMDMQGYGTEDDPFRSSYNTWQVYTHTHGSINYGCFKINITPGTASVITPFNSVSININKTATEMNPIYITGPIGETIGAVPFGKTVKSGVANLVTSATNAYLRIKFGPMAEGMVFDYLLPTIDVNSNSWSSYVYSGQRDYDMATRQQRSNSEGVSGATSTGVMGGILGTTMAGAEIGLLGGPIGAAGGALIGAAAGVASAAIGYAYDTGIGNPRLQAAEDKLHASQPDSILLAGDSNYLFFNTSGQVSATVMKFDDMSINAINNNKEVSGVSYGQNVSDCTNLINAGGPLQIDNLIVTGNIPIGAKKWLKQKFANGVRIVSR